MNNYKSFPPEDLKSLSKTWIGHCWNQYRVISNKVDFMREEVPVYYLVFEDSTDETFWGLFYYTQEDHDFSSIACIELEPVEVLRTEYHTKS